MVFKFRMLSDENDRFVRDYEVMYDMTLSDFHRYICRDLHYDPLTMASFFASDRLWRKLREFTLLDMGAEADSEEGEAPQPMEGVLLGQLVHRLHDRLIFLFDLFGDRAYYLELIAAQEADPDTTYPRTTLAEAPAPDQFAASESAGIGGGSIFDEAMDEFNEFEGDDSYDDE